jgi:hypothetical protein
MAYNPGVTDRSGELMAQGIGRGLEALGQGFTTAIADYNKKKEEKQVIDFATKAITDRASKSPALAKYLNLGDLSDTKALRVGLMAVGGGNAVQGAKVALGGIQEFDRLEAQDAQMRANQRSIQLGAQNIQSGLDVYSGQTDLTPESAKLLSQMSEQAANAAAKRAEAARVPTARAPQFQTFKKTENGVPFEITVQVNPDGTQTEVGRARTDIQPGFKPDSATGGVTPIPGSPVDPNTAGTPASIAAGKAAREVSKEAQAQTKFLAAAESSRSELESTRALVKRARKLSQAGTGGQIEGYLLYKGSRNEQLRSDLDAIKSNLALGKMAELKSLSPTGSTGFGQQSDKELSVMQERFGRLSSTTDEKVVQNTLDDIDVMIERRLNSFNPGAAFGGASQPKASASKLTAPIQVGRFKVIN